MFSGGDYHNSEGKQLPSLKIFSKPLSRIRASQTEPPKHSEQTERDDQLEAAIKYTQPMLTPSDGKLLGDTFLMEISSSAGESQEHGHRPGQDAPRRKRRRTEDTSAGAANSWANRSRR